MDISMFLDVSCDVGDEPLENLTEDDIVLIDEPPPTTNGKRGHSGGTRPPPKRSKPNKKPGITNMKSTLTAQAMGILNNSNLTVKKVPSRPPAVKPVLKQITKPAQPITWKYKQLSENLYNADIKKADLLKDYEPEVCVCKEPPEGEMACGEGCINRSTFTECDKELCTFGERCSNQKIQRRQYAPGLERFMTQKKGWGVRARQALSAGSLILEYTGELCTSQEFEKRMLMRYKGDTHHYCLGMDSKTFIDAHRAGSECRFVNHSCDPNCEMEKWNVNGLWRMAVFAKRDILPGEEITYDYNFSLFNTDQGQECKCGSQECRGVIGGKGKDFLITVNDDAVSASPNRKMSVATDPTGQVAADERWFKSKVVKEELALIVKMAPVPQQLEAKTLKCTVCNECLNFKAQGQIQRHPELGVMMCNKCRKGYGQGGWERDPEGNDEFCRWCSQGGQIYLCDFCPKAFCNKCLKWNLGRKYVQNIEEQEKWKCLLCDPTCIRRARADYYGVFMFYKNKAGKQIVKPKQGKVLKNGTKSPTKAGKSLNFVRPNPIRPVPGIRPIIKNGGTHFVGNGRLPAVRPPINGNYKKHYVDSMLLEADRAANKLRSMINDIRKSWSTNVDRDEKTVVLATQKIREAFANSKVNLDTADKKVIDIYRLNMDEADIRDIEPVLEVKGSAEEAKIFAKSDVIDDIVIEAVETVPDLPFPLDEEEEEVEEIKEEGAEDKIKQTEESKEDGILDMSIEELEEGEDPELKNKIEKDPSENETEKTSTDDFEEINTSIPDPLENENENDNTEVEDSSESSTVPEKKTNSKKSAFGRLQIKSSEEDSFLVVEDDQAAAEKDSDSPLDASADKTVPDEDIELAEEVTEDHKVNTETESELNELINNKNDKKAVEEKETNEEEKETNEEEKETNEEEKESNQEEKETNEEEKETNEEEKESNQEEKETNEEEKESNEEEKKTNKEDMETGEEEKETNKERKTEHSKNEDEEKLNKEVKENGKGSEKCQEEEKDEKSEDKSGVEAESIKKNEIEEPKESTNDDDKENENEHVKEN